MEADKQKSKKPSNEFDNLGGAEAEIRDIRMALAGLSHELGNLLSVISGWAQYWEETQALPQDQSPPARHIYVGVGRIRYCLECLQDCGGTIRRHLAVANVNTMVNSILADLDPRLRANYKLKIVEVAEPWAVVADYWAFDIVFVNLLMNAVALSQPGSAIVVETANVETFEPTDGVGGWLAQGRYVRVSIEYGQEDADGQTLRTPLPDAVAQSALPAAEESLPLSLQILEEHAALLRIEDSSDGRTIVAIFLPALPHHGNATHGCPTEEED
jgi:signal transduction histidine kinase